jgi:hypothetical protein
MDLYFKDYLENVTGLNAPGRAGEKVWAAPSVVTSDHPQIEPSDAKHHVKGVHLKSGFRPMYPAPFKGVTADKFGIKVKKIPRPGQK